MINLVYTTPIHVHDGKLDLAVFYLPNLSHSLPCRIGLKSDDNSLEMQYLILDFEINFVRFLVPSPIGHQIILLSIPSCI